MLLIYDEAQTGLGRTGDRFAFEHEGVVPDILTLSKTLGGGMPLAATITSQEIADHCRTLGFSHYTSHASDPLAAEVGLAVVRTLLADGLADRARRMGARLLAGLRELQSRHEAIGDVRGRGLLLGVELVADRERRPPDAELLVRLSRRCFERGLSVNRAGGAASVWRIAPPLTIDESEVDRALEILDAVLAEDRQA